jgi:hypothetical protein
MAQTGLEKAALLILFAVIAFVIIVVFGYFLILGFGFASGSACFVSSNVRNFFYQDLCVVPQFFCLSSSLSNLGLVPPLLGCSTSTLNYDSQSSPAQTLGGITTALSTCWYQFGANQSLVVSAQPRLCSVLSINTNTNITFNNLTKYLEDSTFSSHISCTGYTPQQACPNYQQGFVCDTNTPTLCQKTELNYSICKTQPNYNNVYQGYVTTHIPLTGANPSASLNMSTELCEPSQGCYFNDSQQSCVNTTDNKIDACTQSYQNFCTKNPEGVYNCTVDYNPTIDSYQSPPSCLLTESVNPTAIENESYFNYLKPGLDLIYSYKNKTSGISNFSRINSSQSISHADLYLVYMNSFTNTRFPPATVSLPQECTPQTFFNNYPTNSIRDECTRAIIVYSGAVLGVGGTGDSGVIMGKVALASVAGGFATAACASNQPCNQYIIPPILNAISTALLTSSGLQQCAEGIFNYITTLGGLYTGSTSFLGRNQIYLCAETS